MGGQTKQQIADDLEKARQHISSQDSSHKQLSKQLEYQNQRLANAETQNQKLRSALCKMDPAALGRLLANVEPEPHSRADVASEKVTVDVVFAESTLQTIRKTNEDLRRDDGDRARRILHLERKLEDVIEDHQDTIQQYSRKVKQLGWENDVVIKRFREQTVEVHELLTEKARWSVEKRKLEAFLAFGACLAKELQNEAGNTKKRRTGSGAATGHDMIVTVEDSIDRTNNDHNPDVAVQKVKTGNAASEITNPEIVTKGTVGQDDASGLQSKSAQSNPSPAKLVTNGDRPNELSFGGSIWKTRFQPFSR